MEKNINKHKTNHSLLVKNFGFIDNVLNKNIGEVDYKQDFGNQIGNVSVVNLNRPLSNYVSSIRNKFKDYIQYAQELNPEMTFFFRYTPIDVYSDSILKASNKEEVLEQYISKRISSSKSEGNFLDRTLDYTKQIVNEIGDITNGGSAQEILYAYDKLALISRQYISYVDKLITESNDNGEYQFGYDITKNMIPHQLTRGYSYDSLREDVNDGVSILNNNSKVSYLHVYTKNEFGGSYNFIDSWDKAFNDTDNLSYNFLYHHLEEKGVGENPLRLYDAVLNRYGRQLQSSKEFLREGNDLAVRYIFNTKEGFADTKLATYAESNQYGMPNAGTTSGNGDDGSKGLQGMNEFYSYGDNATYTEVPYEDSDLIGKTNINFRNGRYQTMIARFSSMVEPSKEKAINDHYDVYQTAISEYGLSHGRNLLRREKKDRNVHHNGDVEKKYNDPYCRVWTNYHQYTHVRNQIRPFMKEKNDKATLISNSDLYDLYGFNRIRTQEIEGFDNGAERLHRHGVMGDAGYVNITPKHQKDNEGILDNTYTTKKCMFSIENLAWKGAWKKDNELNGLSKEQQGPNGGRIMWFPPYGLTFSENVNANWNETQFIGRGEKILSYTDTDRTGSLSFILLIDHPSILNEFKTKIEDGTNNAFEQNDDEYDILRFFAGCGIPDLKERKPQELPKPDPEPQQPQPQEEPIEEETPVPQEEEGKFICMAFFPNNYSGVEDGFDKKVDKEDANSNLVYGRVDPIVYLINGIMSQTALDGKETKNIMTDPKVKNYIGTDGLIGYEIKNNVVEEKGISYYSAKDLENAKQISINTQLTLVPITGLSVDRHTTNRWWYRIDADEKSIPSQPNSHAYRRQRLPAPKGYESKFERYVDRRSFGLNSDGGIEKVYNNRELFHLSEDDIKDYYSLLDVYIASTKEEDVRSKMKENFSNSIDNEYYPKIEEIFKKIREGKIKISKIETEGYASSHGREESNLHLANNRAKTLKKWAETWDVQYDEINALELKTIDSEHQIDVGNDATDDESALKPKLGRAAKITVYFKGEALGTKQSQPDEPIYAEPEPMDLDEEYGDDIVPMNLNLTTVPIDTEAARRYGPANMQQPSLNVNTNQEVTNGLNINNQSAIEALNKNLTKNYVSDFNSDFANNQKIKDILAKQDENMANIWTRTIPTAHERAMENANYRYDNEYQFFKEIDVNDSFVKHKIVEKVKYFDPAYHSISPEGFNSRLTFLHQCTRQGPTNGNSDFNANESQTAANLAFGRQPICILRVGDFYNTKIAIKSLNISYELSNGVQWDLNQEGIGVQPMFAKVDISFTFLGGSDLAGPIARLQNAVSFNYYANTSVYDNRAEMIETSPGGSRYKIYNQGGKTISKTILTN